MVSHQAGLPQPVVSVRREDAKSGYNPRQYADQCAAGRSCLDQSKQI